MKAKSLVIFFICLNASAYIIGALAASGTLTGMDVIGAAPYDASEVEGQFSLLNFSAESVVAGTVGFGIIGLIGWITKQGVYALYAAMIWLVGIFLNIFQFVLTGLSTLLGVLLPTEIAFMGGVIYGGLIVVFFYALAGTIGSRPDWG